MKKLSVRLLGDFSCRVGTGEPLALPTRKACALLAYLASVVGEARSRERLAGLLWGGQPEELARSNLRSTLSRLRKAFPPEAGEMVVTQGGNLLVTATNLEVDVVSFRRLVALATPEALEQAVALYGGPFLDGLEDCDEGFDDWLRAERQALAEAFQQALQQLLEHYVVTGAIDRGIQTALRLLNLDPLQESLHRSLIRLYLYQERLGAALAQYERCRTLLAEELGIDPSAETERLRAEVLKLLPAPLTADEGPPEVEKDSFPERPFLVEAAAALRARQRRNLAGLPSVAVLAFEGDGDPQGALVPRHLACGLAEDIAIELGRFRELEVIAPVSAFAYRDRAPAPELAGRELGAAYVLAGRLRVGTEALRAGIRLVHAETGEQIWAERYDLPRAEVFELQDDAVERIVTAIVGRIEDVRLKAARRKRPGDWGAYDLWLRGWDRLRQPDLAAIKEARQAFQQAMDADPTFARPYVGQALALLNEWACYSWNHWFFLKSDALEMARKAVELDEHDNRAHCMLGISQIYAGDYAKAKKCFTMALNLNPNDCDVLANAACALALIGDHESAVAAGRRALRLAPHHPEWYVVMLGIALYAARHYDEAVEVISTAPDANCSIPAVLAAAYAQRGEPERAPPYRDTVYRHFRRVVARGGHPANSSCVQWLLDLDPFQNPEDAAHYEEGLRKAGFE